MSDEERSNLPEHSESEPASSDAEGELAIRGESRDIDSGNQPAGPAVIISAGTIVELLRASARSTYPLKSKTISRPFYVDESSALRCIPDASIRGRAATKSTLTGG